MPSKNRRKATAAAKQQEALTYSQGHLNGLRWGCVCQNLTEAGDAIRRLEEDFDILPKELRKKIEKLYSNIFQVTEDVFAAEYRARG